MNISTELELIKLEHGAWSAHNIKLSKNIFTISAEHESRSLKRAELYAGLKRTLSKRSLRGCNVLDLGCLEGGISIHLAQEGARCTGIDVRSKHLIKAKFAAKCLGLQRRCTWLEANVTSQNLWEQLKKFDLIICSGLLYHLDAIDILPLLRNMRKACKKDTLVIIDSNIAPQPLKYFAQTGEPTLWGCEWSEHEPNSSASERMAAGWSSMHNNSAFWLTERSLVNALVSAGLGTVIKPLYPYHEWGHQSRDVWVAYPCNPDPCNIPLRPDPDPRPWSHPALSNT